MKDTCQRLISMALLIALLAGCLPGAGPLPSPSWQYADLRVLASPGAGPASHQLVALYTRRLRDQHQIRLDILDLTTDQDFDLYLAVDSAPAGSTRLPIQAEAGLAWDLLLLIPSSGPLQAYGPDGVVRDGLSLRVVRNSVLDTIVVSFADDTLQGAFRIQAFLTTKDTLEVASSLGPVRSDAWPPPRLPVLLAFWNTFPAYTPAQALRRYDGAHSGPASDRHGLRNLLDAVEATRFPAVLLDLKSPASLSALDFAGGLSQVQDLATRNLLILPDLLPLDAPSDNPYQVPAWVRVRSAQDARQVSHTFGLASSPFLYSETFPGELEASIEQIGNYRLIFSAQSPSSELAESITTITPGDKATPEALPSKPTAELSRRGAYIWVNLAPAGKALLASTQASSTGPTLEIRRALLAAAASPQDDQLVVLGGNLAQTAWGNPQAAMQTLHYLSSRPWIQPLTSTELTTLSAPSADNPVGSSSLSAGLQPQEPFILHNPAGEPLAYGLSAQQVHDLLLQELLSAPENAATRLAWQAYDALLAPPVFSSPLLAPLRAAYLGQIGHLLAAAEWGQNGLAVFCIPTGASSYCLAAVDLDWDGEDEYILASPTFFSIFEARGGYLPLAFVRSPDGLHQIIAPSTQFVVGLGDPLSWEPNKGVAGDSTQLRGAFSDLPSGFASPSWELYSVEVSDESLTFNSPDGRLRKNFRLTQSGLQVDYTSIDSLQVQIPIALEPEARFASDWGARYQEQVLQGRYVVGLVDGLQVQVPFSEGTRVEAFNNSLEYMGQAENPDIDYPPGHYTPFPLALVIYQGQGEFSLQLEITFNFKQ